MYPHKQILLTIILLMEMQPSSISEIRKVKAIINKKYTLLIKDPP